MRSRTVKPNHWKDDKLATVSRDARMLYIGLRALGDCAGNLEYRPRRIKAELFPYDDDIAVENLVAELEGIGYAVRYAEGNEQYLHMPWFSRDDYISTHESRDGAKYPSFHQDTVNTLSRQCVDSVETVSGQCEDTPLTLTSTLTVTGTNTRTANMSPPRPQEPLPDNEPNATEVRKVPEIIAAKHRRWSFDEHFTLLREAYERAGVSDLIPDDWGEAYSVWALLDSEQRQSAIDALNERVRAGTSAAYIPRPKRWLRGEYKRPIREPTGPARRGRSSPMDAILREM